MARPINRGAQRRPGPRPGGARRGGGRGRGPIRGGFGGAPTAVLERAPVELPARMTVQDLADRLGVSPTQVISTLVAQNILLTVNQSVDYETAARVAADLGYEVFEAAAEAREKAGGADIAEDDAAL